MTKGDDRKMVGCRPPRCVRHLEMTWRTELYLVKASAPQIDCLVKEHKEVYEDVKWCTKT